MAEQGQDACCKVCGQPIRWGDQDAFYSTMWKWSAHNACLAKYGLVKLAGGEAR